MIHENKNEQFDILNIKGPISVFCIETEIDMLHIVVLSLQLDSEFTIRFASDPDEALRILLIKEYTPDCIILDSSMPHVSGELLFGEIRALPHHHETPVIFLTGHVRSADQQRYLGLGACGTIAKPFDPIYLTQHVRALLGTVSSRAGSNVTQAI